ncbi:helix-turn-helix domain-containing protein [Nocardia sp. NPDC019395]|uniref:TetR/AcrR family transcriptional regulator n=1 Tax=Nocardia sp. NPDC019395 TaxID=3154686 RepID=UPI0033DC0D9E
MRSDAARNRDRILRAARELFLARGTQVPMEEIAEAAGVGVGTLYRRFPDRFALLKAVAIWNMGRVVAEVTAAMAEEPDGHHCLARVLRRIYELRLGDPVPILLPHLLEKTRDDAEFQQARRDAAQAVDSMLDRAKSDGAVRQDLTVADILTIATARPEPSALLGGYAAERLNARYLQIVLDGLSPHPRSEPMAPAVEEAEMEARFTEVAPDSVRPAPQPEHT